MILSFVIVFDNMHLFVEGPLLGTLPPYHFVLLFQQTVLQSQQDNDDNEKLLGQK